MGKFLTRLTPILLAAAIGLPGAACFGAPSVLVQGLMVAGK